MGNRIADLTVKLSADKATFDRDIAQAKKALKGYGGEANRAQRANDGFSAGFGRSADKVSAGSASIKVAMKGVTAGLGLFVAAGAGAVAVVDSIAGAQAQMAREWAAMSVRSGESVGDLQALSYATGQYNISADKTADILKDLTDKTGDYLATGGGEFADFFEDIAPKVGLTAQALADMSGPDALLAVKSAMDETNTSASEQVFYLESIADEASSLIPLLANNGEELKKLDSRFNALNATLTQSEITQLKKYQLNVDDLSIAWQAFSREAILPWVDQLGDAAQYLAEIFSNGRRNLLIGNINDTHTEMVALKEEIVELEEKVANGPKYGGVGFVDALLGNTDNSKILADKKADLDEIRNELGQYQERLAQLDGKPAEGGDTGGGAGGVADKKAIEALQAQGVGRLAALDAQYTDEHGKLVLANEATLAEIANLQVSQEELEARGYESLDVLRDDYAARQKEYFDEKALELETAQAEKDQRELDALQRKEDSKTSKIQQAAAQRAAIEERIDRSLLAMKFQVAGQSLGLIASTAKEGSNLQKAAFIGQKALAAAQVYIQGEVAAMAALALPPIGLGPVAGAGLAGAIRYTSAASAGLILGTSVAGMRELGGPVTGNLPYLVGESGPEIFTPGAGGQITSNNNLKGLGGGGVVVNIHDAPPGSRVERSSDQGREFIDVFLGDLQNDGEMSQGIQNTFGGVSRKGGS